MKITVTVYSGNHFPGGNCLTLDSWTEFVLTCTKTEKAHLKISQQIYEFHPASLPPTSPDFSANVYCISTAF